MAAPSSATSGGLDDIEAGRYRDFASGEALHEHLASLTDQALADA